MTKTVKIIIYFLFLTSVSINYILYRNAIEADSELDKATMFMGNASIMYQEVTSCEFVPPGFAKPIALKTKDQQQVAVNVEHVFDEKDYEVHLEKNIQILSILKDQVAQYSLNDLKVNKDKIEQEVIAIYNSQTIKPVTTFKITELCM